MKKTLLSICKKSALMFVALLLIVGNVFSQQQETDQKIYVDDPNIDQVPQWYYDQVQKSEKGPSVVYTDASGYDNFYLGTDFAESHISVNPTDPTEFFTSYNSSSYYTDAIYRTQDGHDWDDATDVSWGGAMYGDVITAYDGDGRLYYENMYGGILGCKVARSTDNGLSWSGPYTAISGNDKNWMACDQTDGPYANYVYTVMNASGPGGTFARSTNYGASWTTTKTLSDYCDLPGMMVCVGPYFSTDGGAVYMVANGGSTFAPTYRFYVSIDGGASFYDRGSQNFAGYVGTNVGGRHSVENMRTRPYPFIAADNSNGSYRGRLYLVYASNYPAGNGNKPNIYCRYSNDWGLSWSSAVRVNDDSSTANNNWAPAIWCDTQTGRLYIHWMDTRGDAYDDEALIYASYSDNGGASFVANQQISGEKMEINCPTCGGGGTPRYQGDYTSIVSQGGASMSAWTDFRWGSFANFTAYFPDYAMTLSTPSKGTDGVITVDAEVPSVKLYTDDVTFTATIETPPSGSFGISYPSGQTLSSFPGSVPIAITEYDVPVGTYTLTVVGIGPGGTPIHEREVDITVTGPNVWTGAFNYYWSNTNNWSLGHIPTAGEEVIMTTAGYHPPAVDYSDAECYSLTIEAGAGLSIADQTLTIHNDLKVYGNLNFSNTAARCYVYHDVYWYSGSTGNMTGSSRMYIYEDWNFYSGANVQFTSGYVEFVGSSWSYIRSYEENCQFYNLLSNKSTFLLVSNLSAEDLHIAGNLYNNTSANGSEFISLSPHSVILGGFFNNLNGGHFHCTDGTFVFNGSPGIALKPNTGDYFHNLTINTSSSLILDNTYSNELVVNGDVNLQSGTLLAYAFDIKVGDDWTNSGGTFNPGTSTVVFESLVGDPHDVNGSETFYNVQQVNTGNYLRFHGSTTINNNLELNYYCWAYSTFNVNGTLSVDNVGSKFTASGATANATIANLDQGGTIFCNGTATLTINDLVESGIFGTYYAQDAGGVLNLSNGGSYVDLSGNLIVNGGTLNISGNYCYWPYEANASVTMTDGVIDISGCNIYIFDSPAYSLTHNITGGTIRTDRGFSGNRADFTPTAGIFEFYGTFDALLSQSNGCTIPYVVIDKAAKDGSSNYTGKPIIDERSGELITDGSKSNALTLSTDFVVTNHLDITSGSLTLGGYELSVTNDIDVYGTLIMDDAADVLNLGNNYSDQLNFYSGSTANLTAGITNIYGWIIPNAGCTFNLPITHTTVFKGVTGGGPSNHEPTAVYGNIIIDKDPAQKTYVDNSATEAIQLNGNLTLSADNWFEIQNETVIVNGIVSDQSSSKLYVWDIAKDASAMSSTSSKKPNDLIIPGVPVQNETQLTDNGSKGGYFEIYDDFILNGLLGVGDGSVLLHGNFGTSSSGILNIDGGSVIADQAYAKSSASTEGDNPENTDAWQNFYGTINMTDGLFEITHNSLRFLSPAVNNISGGLIRCGFTFYADFSGIFQPSGGSVEFISNDLNPYISCSYVNGNYFHDLIIDRANIIVLFSDIEVKNDVTIENGPLTTYFISNQYDMYIGGDWTNNGGNAAFDEGTGTVIFNGALEGDILTQETFYNMMELKTSGAYTALDMFEDLHILNDLNIDDGALEMNSGDLIIGNDLSIALGAGLNANDPAALIIYVGGNWVNSNVDYDIYHGFSPGTCSVVFNTTGDNLLSTNAPQEDFYNLTIYKTTDQFRSNDNIQVFGDFLLFDGEWNDNIGGLTHTFHGDFEVTSNAAWFTHVSPNTVVFAGTADQNFTYNHIGAGYFKHVIIDKSPTDYMINSDPDQSVNNQMFDGDDPLAQQFTMLTDMDIQLGGTLTIDNGTMNVNGNTLRGDGDITINSGGILSLAPNSTLWIDDGSLLNVNGGLLESIGTPGNEISIRHRNTGYYGFKVQNGGTISAEYTWFQYTDGNGVWVDTDGLVDPSHAFNYCTFLNGTPGFAPLLVLNNAQTLICTGVDFPQSGVCDINAAKAFDVGDVTFMNAVGDFAGEDYDYDAYDRIHWQHTDVILELTTFLEGPYNGVNLNTNLNGTLPLNQPYDVGLPYWGTPVPDWYYTGGETVGSIPNVNVVDWVIVELRDATSPATATPGTSVGKQAAFLLNDGSVVGLDGSSNLVFSPAYSNDLYVVVWHRNHIGVMGTNPLVEVGGVNPYDFTATGQAYGAGAMSELSPGVWGMRSGDGNGNSQIDVLDEQSVWETWAGYYEGYHEADYNMDRQINNIDKNDKWFPNLGSGTMVP